MYLENWVLFGGAVSLEKVVGMIDPVRVTNSKREFLQRAPWL